MNYAIEKLELGEFEGFTLRAKVVPDYITDPATDFDCYTENQIASYKYDEWSFVTLEVSAWVSGVELGTWSLGAIEYGDFPITDDQDNITGKTQIDLEKILSPDYGYREDAIEGAIFEAKATLERIADKLPNLLTVNMLNVLATTN